MTAQDFHDAVVEHKGPIHVVDDENRDIGCTTPTTRHAILSELAGIDSDRPAPWRIMEHDPDWMLLDRSRKQR